VGLALQSMAILNNWSLRLFLGTRVLTGFFSGTSPVAKAFLADIGGGKGDNKIAQYLGWKDASSTLAYIIGPALGGLLFEAKRNSLLRLKVLNAFDKVAIGNASTSALAFVILISAIFSLMAASLVALFVEPDNQKFKKTSPFEEKNEMDQIEKNDFNLISCPLGTSLYTGIVSVCIVSFLYHVADSTFFAFFPALLSDLMNLTPHQIGLLFTSLACLSFTMSASSLSSVLIRKLGTVKTCVIGLCSIGSGLGLLSFAGGLSSSCSGILIPVVMVASSLYFCGVPLYGPTIPTMLLQCVPPNQRGTGE